MVSILAVVMIGAAGLQHDVLVKMRSQYHIDSVAYLDNAPPVVALTTVILGGFRGLIADMLWLRITYLQDKGNYFELVQLSDWVTKLEPRNTEIWGFHAWNMAYNISVMMSADEDRWRWVSNGIKLLRDEGIIYNPGDPDLYRNLGWIYLHKIGRPIDLSYQYYKDELAKEMNMLFNGPRPDYGNISPALMKKMVDDYKLIPEVMEKIEKEYGALDWRVPESHAVYWAYRGIQQADEGENTSMCEHMIKQGLRFIKEAEEAPKQ